MNLQINESIFKWFFSLGLCKSSDGKKLKNLKYELNPTISQKIETGPLIIDLINKMLKQINEILASPLPISLKNNHIKQVASPASRFYNWNLIKETLSLIGFNIDKETINLIVLGDLPMISEFLNELYEFYKNSNKFIHNNNNSLSLETVDLSKSMVVNDASKILKNLPSNTKEAIELLGLQSSKALKETTSLMEFFVLNLAQSLNLKPNQVGFCKILIKIFKGSYAFN